MVEKASGGHFKHVILKPLCVLFLVVMSKVAKELHERAHALCFIANSVNFPVTCEPIIEVSSENVA